MSIESSKQKGIKPNKIQLIYAGGTFGSYGRPLDTLPADVFIPLILSHIHQNITTSIEALTNTCVKDSSQLTPEDFVHFYQLILNNYSADNRHFIILTGTDTLSYLGAFLAEAFAGSDICITLTASMTPFFDVDIIHHYHVNKHSDACTNLKNAISSTTKNISGVHIAFGGEIWAAQTVQKIHSHDVMAFTGYSHAGYPDSSYVNYLPDKQRQIWIKSRLSTLTQILQQAKTIIIPTLFSVPNTADWAALQLESLTNLRPTGVILVGFGAGNLPYNGVFATAMDSLYQQGFMLVCTTQCPYGGVSDAYAAGSWQYKHHVLSAGCLTIPAIYARLLWLHLAYDNARQRRQCWTQHINKS